MGTLIWLVLLIGVPLTLAYRRTDLKTATAVLGALLIAYWLFGDGGAIWNTILLIHAADQVPWAQPKELPYSPNAPLPALGHTSANGTNVAMADGSVRFLKSGTPEAVIRGLITRAGGEQVTID